MPTLHAQGSTILLFIVIFSIKIKKLYLQNFQIIKYEKLYVIFWGGKAKQLFYLTRVGTWLGKAPKHPYVI